MTQQEKGVEEGKAGNESQRLLRHLSPQAEHAGLPRSQSCSFRAQMVAGDWHCISSAAPIRRQAILEPNKDYPPQRLAKAVGGGVGC